MVQRTFRNDFVFFIVGPNKSPFQERFSKMSQEPTVPFWYPFEGHYGLFRRFLRTPSSLRFCPVATKLKAHKRDGTGKQFEFLDRAWLSCHFFQTGTCSRQACAKTHSLLFAAVIIISIFRLRGCISYYGWWVRLFIIKKKNLLANLSRKINCSVDERNICSLLSEYVVSASASVLGSMILSPCLCGFSQGTPVFSHIP